MHSRGTGHIREVADTSRNSQQTVRLIQTPVLSTTPSPFIATSTTLSPPSTVQLSVPCIHPHSHLTSSSRITRRTTVCTDTLSHAESW